MNEDPSRTQPIWQLGDPWRDLAPELAGESPVTVISQHGTARILGHGRQTRVPLEGGHLMAFDLIRHPLRGVVSASPCGIHTVSYMGEWHMTAPLILVLVGEHPRWLLTDIGRRVFEKAMSQGWHVEGHPAEVCGALHCLRRHQS